METDNLIYGFQGPHRFLSNFWPVPHGIVFDNVIYPTVEHAYQAGKTLDPRQRRAILNASTPGEAKQIGRRMEITQPDWEDWKLFHMEALVRSKFLAGTKLGAQLLRTGGAKLVEANTWGDRFWGKCHGTGKNHLGEILMEVRDDLRIQYTTWKRSV